MHQNWCAALVRKGVRTAVPAAGPRRPRALRAALRQNPLNQAEIELPWRVLELHCHWQGPWERLGTCWEQSWERKSWVTKLLLVLEYSLVQRAQN